jgi:hypothetical protein
MRTHQWGREVHCPDISLAWAKAAIGHEELPWQSTASHLLTWAWELA